MFGIALPLGIIPGSFIEAFAKLARTINVRMASYTGITTEYSTVKCGHLEPKI